jgi:hypothetical protein
MPTFPKKLGPEVRSIPAGTPYQQFPIPAGAFGVDGGVEELGRGLTKGSEAIFSAAAHELSDEHDRIAKEKDIELSQRIRSRLYGDGTTESQGYFGLSGSNAIDNYTATQQGIQQDFDDIYKGIDNNNIRRIFKAAGLERLLTANKLTSKHNITQTKIAQLATAEAQKNTAIDNASLAPFDTNAEGTGTVDISIAKTLNAVHTEAKIRGSSPEVIVEEQGKALTSLFSSMIIATKERGDILGAVALLKKYRGRMDSPEAAALTAKLIEPQQTAEAQKQVTKYIHSIDFHPNGERRKTKRTRAKILSTARAELASKPKLRDDVIGRLQDRFDEEDELKKDHLIELNSKWHSAIINGKMTLDELKLRYTEEWEILSGNAKDVKALIAAQKNRITGKEFALTNESGIESYLVGLDKETLARQKGESYKARMDGVTWPKWFGPSGTATAAKRAIEARGKSGVIYDRMRKILGDMAPTNLKLFKTGQSKVQREIQKRIIRQTDKWILEKIETGKDITEEEIRAQAALFLQPVRRGGLVADVRDYLDSSSGISAAEARATFSEADKKIVRVDFDEMLEEHIMGIKAQFMKPRSQGGGGGVVPSEKQMEEYMGAWLMDDHKRMNRLLGVGQPAKSPLP